MRTETEHRATERLETAAASAGSQWPSGHAGPNAGERPGAGLEQAQASRRASAAYDSAADHFDDSALGFWDRYGQSTVRNLALKRGAHVLDAGCGTGASALHAAATVAPEGRVVGIDVSAGLLARAREKARQRQLSNVEFRMLDMCHLDYPAESFDAVICVFAIFFVPDMARQLAELWRVVKPGGQIAITTWGPGLFEPGNGIFWSTLRQIRPELELEYNPWDRITDPEALRRLFMEAGAGEPQLFAERGVQPLEKPEDWWTIVCGTGFRWTLDQLTEGEREQMRSQNLRLMARLGATSVKTNTICAIARKTTD